MNPRLCLTLVVSFAVIRLFADVDIGSTREEVIKELGEPIGTLRVGAREDFNYANDVVVTLQNGKVTRIRNREGMKGKSAPPAKAPSATPTATASPAAAKATPAAVTTPLPDTPAMFNGVPKATIVTDPAFRTEGSAGGESDGKTLGIDGKPMSPQDIYYNDSTHFRSRFDNGLGQVLSRQDSDRLYSLQSVFSALDDARRLKAVESYKRYHKQEPDQDSLAHLAQIKARLIKAQSAFEMARYHVGQLESLKVKDRIDLEAASSEAGRKHRADMKQAIAEIHRWRTMLETEFPHIVEAGRKADVAKWAKISGAEAFGTTKGDKILLFIHQSFERTPMLEGLAEASEGRVFERAKPLHIPSGTRVQILEKKSINAPAGTNRAAKQLELTRIRIKAPGVQQLDGADLSSMTFEGWVLSQHVEPAK
jgi:hypothetical protein